MPFSPPDISGLKVWLKADVDTWQDSGFTTAAAAEGDPVGGWKDQSGLNNHFTQATAGNKPALRLRRQNQLPVIHFDGTDDTLASSFTLAQPDTIFIAGHMLALPSGAPFIDSGSGNQQLVGIFGATWQIFAGTGLTGGTAVPGWQNHSAIFNNTASALYKNGVLIVSGTAGTNSLTNATLGRQQASTFLSGYIGEVIIYDTALSDTSRWQVENYLFTRWLTRNLGFQRNALRPRPFAPGLAR